MAVRMAFVGFRHGHITSIYKQAQECEYVEVVGAVEEDPAHRADFAEPAGIELTHETMDELLNEVDCDVIATGDYYGKRGQITIDALKANKHVLADKPMCTSRQQLEEIKSLCEANDREIMIALTMRYNPGTRWMAQVVQEGGIGEFCTGIVIGLHPLAHGTRPDWYFEEGKQGGTINDLFIHGTDMIRWATELEFDKIIAAEAWNARADWAPFFQDSAQVVYQMDNAAKVMADVSYLTPEAAGWGPWEFFLWGTEGHVHVQGDDLLWQRADEGDMPLEAVDPPAFENCVTDFASHLEEGTPRLLSMDDCLQAQLAALAGQEAADTETRDMPMPQL